MLIYCSWRICRQVYDNDKNAIDAQRLQGDRPGCQPGGAHHKGLPYVHEILCAGEEHFQNNCENNDVRGLEIQSVCYEKGMKTGQFMPEASKTTLDWLKESFSEVWDKEIWPPSSPYCKPLDYFVCGVSEFRVNAKPHNKTAYLILYNISITTTKSGMGYQGIMINNEP